MDAETSCHPSFILNTNRVVVGFSAPLSVRYSTKREIDNLLNGGLELNELLRNTGIRRG
jgi:hypothetical protein